MHPLLNLLSEIDDKYGLIYQELIKQFLKDELVKMPPINSFHEYSTFEEFFDLDVYPETYFYLVKYDDSEYLDYFDNSILNIKTGRFGPQRINNIYSFVRIMESDVFYIVKSD